MTSDLPAGASSVLQAGQLRDFSDRFSPVFVRDLRRGLRSSFFVWTFVIFQVLALVIAIAEWAVVQVLGDMGAGAIFSQIFTGSFTFLFGLVLPLSQFNALSTELGTTRNIELLLTSSLSRWQIVRGKLFVASSLGTLLLISLLPYFFIRYFLGNTELVATIQSLGLLVLTNATMNAIVISASGVSSYVGRAFVIFALWMITAFFGATTGIRAAMFGLTPSVIPLLITTVGTSLLLLVLCLQLARGRLKVAENPIDPPSIALVIVFIIISPVVYGVAIAVGGLWTGSVVVALMLIGAFRMDPEEAKSA